MIPRIGHGYDVHRLVEGRSLILGGVEIPYEKGLLGHSDADVLLHALMDALLGKLNLYRAAIERVLIAPFGSIVLFEVKELQLLAAGVDAVIMTST